MLNENAKKLFVIGASRGIGLQLLVQALESGHTVTAFARSAANIPIQHERLRRIAGDVTCDSAALTSAMQGQDVIISTLGRGMSLKSEHLIERSVPNIVGAMRANGLRRLIFTSAIGVGGTIDGLPLFARLMARFPLRNLYADKVAGEAQIQRSDLDWTLVQPAQLTDGPLTRKYRFGERLELQGRPKISRADTAHFILTLVEDSTFAGKVLLVSQ